MSGNCPNCGAPKHGARCEYCGTSFARYQGCATIEIENDFTNFYSFDGEIVYRIPMEPRVIVTVEDGGVRYDGA